MSAGRRKLLVRWASVYRQAETALEAASSKNPAENLHELAMQVLGQVLSQNELALLQQAVQQVSYANRCSGRAKIGDVCSVAEHSSKTRHVFPLPLRRFIADPKPFQLTDDRIFGRRHPHLQVTVSPKGFYGCSVHPFQVERPLRTDKDVDLVGRRQMNQVETGLAADGFTNGGFTDVVVTVETRQEVGSLLLGQLAKQIDIHG